jgi:hypothetical protein
MRVRSSKHEWTELPAPAWWKPEGPGSRRGQLEGGAWPESCYPGQA